MTMLPSTLALLRQRDAATYLPLIAPPNGTMEWFHKAAHLQICRGYYRAITSRDGADVYLLRIWLTAPASVRESPSGDFSVDFDSSSSVLLHLIRTPDDAPDCHTHPWCFSSEVLAGGYLEKRREFVDGSWTDEKAIARPVRATAHYSHGIAHRIVDLLPPTWTLIQTGPRLAEKDHWHFIDGQRAVESSDYLRVRAMCPESAETAKATL